MKKCGTRDVGPHEPPGTVAAPEFNNTGAAPRARRRIAFFLRAIVGVLLTAACAYVICAGWPLVPTAAGRLTRSAWPVLAHASVPLIACAAACHVMNLFLLSYRWVLLLRSGGLRVGLPTALVWHRRCAMAELLGFGEIAVDAGRATFISLYSGRRGLALSTVAVERLCGAGVMCVMLGIGLVLLSRNATSTDVLMEWTLLALELMLLLVVSAALVLLVVFPRWSRAGFGRLGLHVEGGQGHVLHGRAVAQCLAVTAAVQALCVAQYGLLARSVGVSLSPALLLILVPACMVAFLAPFTIAGLGVFEATFIAITTACAPVGLEQAIGLCVLHRVLSIAYRLLDATFFLVPTHDTAGQVAHMRRLELLALKAVEP